MILLDNEKFVNNITNKYIEMFPNLNNKQLKKNLLIFHIFIVFFIILLYFFIDNKKYKIIIILLTIIISIQHFIFNGCILTKIELNLYNDNYTSIDPLLNCLYIETTNKNRIKYTKILGIITLIFFIIFFNKKITFINISKKYFSI
jgi:hypothetical protein